MAAKVVLLSNAKFFCVCVHNEKGRPYFVSYYRKSTQGINKFYFTTYLLY